jgi:NAD(P)-dependent dehydrogenase (short-subunit alcohol dehydrogenase family)
MTKTIAIFGVGPGMSRSVAERFGREGFRLALVARNGAKLDRYVDEFGAAGVEAAGFVADVTDRDQLRTVIAAIQERFGPIDVAVFTAINLDSAVVDVLQIDPEALPGQLDLALWTPITLVGELLPGMLERGDGSILLSSGVSALSPIPQLGNVGLGLAALRNYVQNLNQVVAERGVYVGVIHVGGLIERSDASLAMVQNAPEGIGAIPSVDPDVLADTAWDLHTTRNRFEQVVGTFAQ